MESPTLSSSMLLRFPMPTTMSPSNESIDLRPFTCPEPGCFQRFKRKFTLKEHIKTHTGEKPFTCPVKSCSKTFTTSGNLARHKRLHPWLKPQVCLVDGCDRSFSNEMKLERHMKTHFKGPRVLHPCTLAGCGKQFSTTGNLTRHLKQQHHHEATSNSDSDDSTRSGRVSCVASPCGMDNSYDLRTFVPPPPTTTTSSTTRYDRIGFDAARAFNPLMDEISDVNDEELLATLQCLF